MSTIHVSRSGQRFGPYSVEKARSYVESGHIHADDLVWSEDQADWTHPLDHPLLSGCQLPPPPLLSAPPPRPANPIASTTSRMEVGGWLLFLCILLTVVNPTAIFVELMGGLSIRSGVPIGFLSLYAGIGVGSFVVGLGLWRKKRGAVQNAKRFLILLGFWPIVALFALNWDASNSAAALNLRVPHKNLLDYSVIKAEYKGHVERNNPYVVGKSLREYSQMMNTVGGTNDYDEGIQGNFGVIDTLFADTAKAIIPQIFYSLLWYLYLSRSKRVKATFPELVRSQQEHSDCHKADSTIIETIPLQASSPSTNRTPDPFPEMEGLGWWIILLILFSAIVLIILFHVPL